MAEEEVKKTRAKKPKVYSKNFHLKHIGNIGGQPVTAEIDAALNAALALAGQKASDYHIDA